jgi:hypothetical protein
MIERSAKNVAGLHGGRKLIECPKASVGLSVASRFTIPDEPTAP